MCGAALLFAAYNAQHLIVALEPHKTQKLMIEKLRTLTGPDEELSLYFPGRKRRNHGERSAFEPSSVFYAGGDIAELGSPKEAASFFRESGTYCIVRRSYLMGLRVMLERDGIQTDIVDESNYRFTIIKMTEDTGPATSPRSRGTSPEE